jgi:two-component system sensor histidine kinase PilS (NtrC family)
VNSATPQIERRKKARRRSDAVVARAAEEPDLAWRVLGTLSAFRILIAGALLILFSVGGESRIFGDLYPAMFLAVSTTYLALAILFIIALQQRWMSAGVQAVAHALVDIVAIVLLMHASGGVASGLGGLLIVFIGAGSLVLPFQYPMALAALTTFAVLGEQLFTQFAGTSTIPNYPAAGILSAIVLAMAAAARPLGRRIQASEELARQRGVDLRNLSELNQYIVQHLRESILVIDADDCVRLSNASATQMLGTEPQQQGTPLGQVFAPLAEYIPRWRVQASMSAHPEFAVASGDNVTITAHLAPLGRGGRRDGPVLVFLEDASVLNERVQQSKLASLGRLSASIAHEIRNPVGAMSHAAQLLGEAEGLSEDDVRLTQIIRAHSERVSHIIDNILQLSRRESSRPERLHVKPWLQEFAREFARTLELQEGQVSVMETPDELEVRMDPSHLRQVLWNLCDNAVKYASETGGILVELQAGRLQGRGRPYVDVMDHGVGIEPATVEKIFEPFFTERQGGTGLGLYISRELCELNRAALMYLDRPDGGSIFRIVFTDPDRWEAE